jgi:hypothetical protein
MKTILKADLTPSEKIDLRSLLGDEAKKRGAGSSHAGAGAVKTPAR